MGGRAFDSQLILICTQIIAGFATYFTLVKAATKLTGTASQPSVKVGHCASQRVFVPVYIIFVKVEMQLHITMRGNCCNSSGPLQHVTVRSEPCDCPSQSIKLLPPHDHIGRKMVLLNSRLGSYKQRLMAPSEI